MKKEEFCCGCGGDEHKERKEGGLWCWVCNDWVQPIPAALLAELEQAERRHEELADFAAQESVRLRDANLRAAQAERERDAALNLIGRIASGEGGGFNWAVRMAQEFSTERTERLVAERDASKWEQAQEQPQHPGPWSSDEASDRPYREQAQGETT